MPMNSRFFNANPILDSESKEIVGYDRVYDARDFAGYFYKLVKDGVFAQPANQLQVVAKDGLTITVKSGAAWIEGYMGELLEDEDYVVQPNLSSSTQTVKVVCVLLKAERKIDIEVVQGDLKPVNNATRHELVLASFSLSAGTSSITDAMISDRRYQDAYCGIVTGMVQNISTTELFKQYDDMFNTWFNKLQDVMTDNVALNLQKQIDALAVKAINMYYVDYIRDYSTKVKLKYYMCVDTFNSGATFITNSNSLHREKEYKEGTYIVFLDVSYEDVVIDEDSIEDVTLASQDNFVRVNVSIEQSTYNNVSTGVSGNIGVITPNNLVNASSFGRVNFAGRKKSYFEDKEWIWLPRKHAISCRCIFSVKKGELMPSEIIDGAKSEIGFSVRTSFRVWMNNNNGVYQDVREDIELSTSVELNIGVYRIF